MEDFSEWAKRKADHGGLQAVQVDVRGVHGLHKAIRYKHAASMAASQAKAKDRADKHLQGIKEKVPQLLAKAKDMVTATAKNGDWRHIGDIGRIVESLGHAAGHLGNYQHKSTMPSGKTPGEAVRQKYGEAQKLAKEVLGGSSKMAGDKKLNWGHVGSLGFVHGQVHGELHGEDLKMP